MRRMIAVSVVAVVGFTVVPQIAVGAVIERVSVAMNSAQANADSGSTAISANGRYVAFTSAASNLVPGDTNRAGDVFVRDLWAGTTRRVSVASDGTQAHSNSGSPAISANGRYVAFISSASNLVRGDTNHADDVFVRDLRSGSTRRVSVASDGTQANSNSASPAISADGRYVAFDSSASNLVPGDTNGHNADVFVRDLRSDTTRLVSVASDGTQPNEGSLRPAISADGRYVAFNSVNASDNLDVFVRDLRSDTTQRVSVASDGTPAENGSAGAAISADGRYVAFFSIAPNLVPGDTNGLDDEFVRDLRSDTTQRVSVASDGTQANNESGELGAAISADGRYVAFQSFASNLVPGTSGGVFVRDLRSGTTRLVSLTMNGAQDNGTSSYPAISADGRYVVFQSDASNLVPGDTNNNADVFVRDLKPGPQPANNKFTVSHIRITARGTSTFSVRVPGPGSLDVLETARDNNLASTAAVVKPAPHRFVFARAHVHATRGGTVRMTVTPNRRGRRLVAHPRYRIILRLSVRYTPRGGLYHTIGYLGLHLPATCAKHNTVTALNRRTVVRCS